MRGNSDDNGPNVPLLKLLDCSLRISVFFLSIATIWLTVTNHQDNTSYGKLHFNNFSGLKYMVCISTISAVYAFVAAISSWIRCLVSKAWLFFVSDQIVTYLLVTSVAAVIEMMFLAYKGDKAVSWSEACASYGKFCSRMKLALILQSLALLSFLVLAVIYAYRVFSMYEAPSISHKGVELEENTT
ncbi:CASP-like protein 2D1 [Argentina anserina]|uniref:CASP-like protein 2D1 n=1 Tax=Argentina anserina TaxID=57926 RepID=UPI00217650F4|nr:CASP-like protein 2D1 [Potentilla anserina]